MHTKGGIDIQAVAILPEKKSESFCKELNPDEQNTKILIKINKDRAEYYNFDDDCFYKLDIEIAKKYIKKEDNICN